MGAGSFVLTEASEEDYRLSRALAKVDLFFEMNLDADGILRAQDLFGQVAHRELRVLSAKQVIKKYPALALVSMLGHASIGYSQGRFWEGYWEAIGVDQRDDFETALRHTLSALLRRYDMRDAANLVADSRYVPAMALHAGIPVNCLNDVIVAVEEHVRRGEDPTGVALVDWLMDPARPHRLAALASPIGEFLYEGGPVAVDMMDRIVEFLLTTQDHPDPWNDLSLDTRSTGLPTVVIDGLLERLRGRRFGEGRSTAGAVSRRRKPAISFAIDDEQIMVGIPFPPSDDDQPWAVTIAGVTRDVYAERGWGIADGESHPDTLIGVPSPTREVTMIHRPSGVSERVAVVDAADPLMLFTVEGVRLSARASLPRGEVLAVFPRDSDIVDAVSGETLASGQSEIGLSSWAGWVSCILNLAGHDSIQLKRENRDPGPVHGVRVAGAPSVVPGEPVSGLHTAQGLAVYNERPWVWLPAHIGTEPVSWRIRVREVGSSYAIADTKCESGRDDAYFDPWEGVPGPILGQYEIHVLGPAGSDARCSVFIAEDVDVVHELAFRTPTPAGLAPSTTLVELPEGLMAEANTIEFSDVDKSRVFEIRRGRSGYQLKVTPPYFEARIDLRGDPAQWRTSEFVVTPAALEEYAVVAARIPGDVEVDFALVDGNGAVVQAEEPSALNGNIFELPTRRFADAARRLGTCTLVARADLAEDEYVVPVATIQPAKLYGEVSLRDRALEFTDLADHKNLAAWVWPATAPWKAVDRVPLERNRADLPDELIDAGPLIVQVFVDDQWEVVPRPSRPDRSSAMTAQAGWFRDASSAMDTLARFLANEGPAPTTADAVEGAWAVLAMIDWYDGRDRIRINNAMEDLLRRHPRTALETLGRSSISTDEQVALLIRSKVLEKPYSARDTANELHPDPWIGCLVEVSDLYSLYRRRTLVADERIESIEYLRSRGGESLIAILREGAVKDSSKGAFDRSAESVDQLDEDDQNTVFRTLQLVPGAVLDIDSRTSAVAEAFHRRHEWTDTLSCLELHDQVADMISAVRAVSPHLHKAIADREAALGDADVDERPWLMLSVQSLAIAAAARLDARGEFERSPITPAVRENWAVLAEHFPRLVMADVLIADAAATHLAYSDLIGE